MLPVLFLLIHAPLQVGDGKPYRRIEQALHDASSGDAIEVYPSKNGYERTALLITKKIRLRAVGRIVLDGAGFDYSGRGSAPRAIVQVQQEGSGSVIDGLELTGARNESFNGAGIRVTGANDVTVAHCNIHGNDMGIMSDGVLGSSSEAANQHYVACEIHENGTDRQPGQNHNLYLSGRSAFIDNCLIWGALTGHNLKSRAHFTSVNDSVLYGGSNRQIDCVDSDFTRSPNSNLVVSNCILAMDGNSTGNGNVIHFGAESGVRKGTAYILQSTIFTEFLPPIVLLDSPGASARFDDSIIIDPDPMHPTLVGVDKGAAVSGELGTSNWISDGYLLADKTLANRGFKFSGAQPATRLVPSMNSSGFTLEGVAPKAARPTYRDGEGKIHELKNWSPRVGAETNLFNKLIYRSKIGS